MHIPDGMLSPAAVLTLGVAGFGGIAFAARRAQRELDEAQAPLMGVLGAFVFAAQMVNFPLVSGVSGHLLGATLLAALLGPAPAMIVLTAILVLQALVFQDGGLLALGANVFNMAIAGTLAGYWPWRALAAGRAGAASTRSRAGLAVGGFCSILVAPACVSANSASPASTSAARRSPSLSVHSWSTRCWKAWLTVGVASGARIHPARLVESACRGAPSCARPVARVVARARLDWIPGRVDAARCSRKAGAGEWTRRARHALFKAPLSDYQLAINAAEWLRKPAVGLFGVALAAGLCALLARGLRARRSA